MINLIPPHAQRIVRNEYIARVAVVWQYLFVCAFLGGMAALLPTYVLFAKQTQTLVVTTSDTTAQIEQEYATTLAELDAATAIARQLATPRPSVSVSSVVRHVETARAADIEISGVSLVLDKEGERVTIEGVAQTRSALQQFLDSLKRDAYFKDPKVPVSHFAKDKNLPFTATAYVRTAP